MTIDPSTSNPIGDCLGDVELARALVQQAGALASRMRAADDLVGEQKTSVSDVVTAADHAAEEFVVQTLRRLRPDDGVLGEEGTEFTGGSGRTWVIDPVDGTYNFLSGMAYWCSALALTDSAGTVLGAVHQPATDETWLGGRDLPTTRNDQPVPVVADRPLEHCSLGTYLPPDAMSDDAALQPFRALLGAVATPRVLGSGSVDLASVATGRLGCWAQHSCPAWDWLPGRALVEAAGGSTDIVERHGRRWHLAGGAQAVRAMRALISGA